MKCQKCLLLFPEEFLDLSHDVPVYLFEGTTRNIRKNQADKFPRRYLCKTCHSIYEDLLRIELRFKAMDYARRYFK